MARRPAGGAPRPEGLERRRSKVRAMISSEVQRTLVKSPPELWAELSDPAALARHLGELGEIRIVRTEPESTVEWEGERISGTVSIKPSGWGTKVTLSVTRELDGPPADAIEEAVGAGEEASGAGEEASGAGEEASGAIDETPETGDAIADTPDTIADTPDAIAETPDTIEEAPTEPAERAPEPRPGFLARLFKRRHKPVAAHTPAEAVDVARTPPAPLHTEADAFAAMSEALAPETVAVAVAGTFDALPVVDTASPSAADPLGEHEGVEGPSEPKQAHDISAELRAAEELAEGEVTALLTAVLDRLGAAHHRPFSRA